MFRESRLAEKAVQYVVNPKPTRSAHAAGGRGGGSTGGGSTGGGSTGGGATGGGPTP